MTGLLWSIATTTASTSSYPDGTNRVLPVFQPDPHRYIFPVALSNIRIFRIHFSFFRLQRREGTEITPSLYIGRRPPCGTAFRMALSVFAEQIVPGTSICTSKTDFCLTSDQRGKISNRPSITESDDTTSPIPAFEREGRLVRLEARTSSRKQNPNNSRIPAINHKLFFALFILSSFQTGPR